MGMSDDLRSIDRAMLLALTHRQRDSTPLSRDRERLLDRLGLRKATILLQLLDFALEFRFVLKAIVTGQATHDFAAFPILEDTAQVFAGNSGHGREVALPDLVLDDDAVRSDIPPEMIRQFEQRKGNATLQRQEAPSSDRHVGLA